MVCSVALLASMMPTAAFAEGPTPTPTASVENATPTPSPDPAASAEPTVSPEPTVEPTQAPEGTAVPTAQPTPTPEGTAVPAESAASDAESTVEPSAEPTAQPTEQPAEEAAPSEQPQSDATAPESSANSDVETYGGWHDWDDDWWEDHFPDWGEDWDKGYYVWNVANITRKHNGGYELERVYHDDVNNPDHVSVYVSDQENGPYEMIAPHERAWEGRQWVARNERFIKIVPEKGYYVKYAVVACDYLGGYGCTVLADGDGYGTSTEPGDASIILVADESNHFYDHDDLAGTSVERFPYHVFIELAECPDPAYVVYDAGEAGGEQVTAAMLDGAIVSNDNGGIINNRNKTDVAFSFEDNPENYEVLAPTKNMVRVGNKTYEFVGWKLQYYSDDIDDVDDAFDMEDETNQEPTTVQPDGKIDLYAHAKLTAQWEEVKGPVVQPGAPVTVNVYLDGDPVKVTRNDQYIDLSLASTTDNPAVNVTPEGSYQCTYDYLTYNCADLQFTVNNSYVLQAVQADLVYGESGSKGVTTEKDTTKVDNVQGGSIVNIYLATPYSVEYYVDGELSETDETTYTVDNTADLPENGGLPSEDDPDSEGMQDASTVVWKMDPINDTITLKATDDLNAWYPKWKNGEVAGKIISGSLALSAILSDKDTYTVEDNTIKFFGTAQHKSVELTKEITSIQRGNETYTVETIPDGTLKVNDVITYEITVTNTGNVALNGLTVTDKFEGAGTPSSVVIKDGNGESVGAWNNKVWTVEDVALEKGESVVYTYTYTVDEADMGNTIKNTAAVTGEDGVNGKDTEETPAVENPDPVVDVEKEVTQIMRGDTDITNNVGEDNKLKVGDVITYKVTVSNKGNTTLTDLTVTDTFNGSAQPENGKNNQFALNWEPKEDGGWLGSFKFGKFEAGSSSYTTYNYTVTEADMGKTITNTVSVVDENGVKDEDKDTPQYPVEKAEPRVTVDKTYTAMRGDEQVPDGENLQVGDKITYQITVENTGNVTLKKLIVTDTFTGAGELENFTMDPDAGTKYKWTISDLAVGKDWTVTYTYTVIEADLGNTITNTAVVSGDADGKDDDPPTLPVEDESDAVAFDKKLTQIKRGNQTISAADISNDTMLQAGDVLTYTITVKNTGNVTVNDLTISDTFNGTGDQPQGDSITWTGKAGAWTGTVDGVSLTAGDTKTYKYTYTVVDTDKGATLKNEATLRRGEEYAGSVVNENVVADPSVTVDKTYTVMRDGKTVEVSNDNPLKVGDAITYTITVTNDGNIALENLTVTDNLNGKGEQPTGESITWTKDKEGWNGTAEIASMDVGQIFTFTYTYTVAEADLGSDNQPGSIKNTAVVNGGGLPEGGSEGETETPVEPAGTVVVFDKKLTQIERGDETITDIDSNTALEVGDTLTYTITVTNNGNYTLTDLDIIDTFNGMGDEPTGSFTWEGEAGNRTATAKIESMGVGQVFTYNYTYTVQLEDVGKTLTNTAQLLRGNETLGGGKTENPVPKAPAYLFEKALTQIVRDGEPLNLDRIDDDTMLKSGDEITYTITVTNNGNVALNDLEITDTFNGLGDKPQGGSITWDGKAGEWTGHVAVNSLPVGQTTTYTYTVDVMDEGNTLINTATINGSEEDGVEQIVYKNQNLVELHTVYFEKALTQIVRGDETIPADQISNDTILQAGDELTYTITLKNTGNVTLNGLTITDTFNGMGEQPQSTSLTWNGTAGEWESNIAVGPLPVGQTTTYTYTYTVAEADKGATLTNTAKLTDSEGDVPEIVYENKNVVGIPDAQVTKTVTKIVRNGEDVAPYDENNNAVSLKVGDVVTYEIKVENTGNVDLTGLTLTDEFNGMGEQPQSTSLTWDGTAGEGSWYSKTEMNLPVGQTTTYTYTYTVVQQDGVVDAVKDNVLKNVATVSGAGLPQEIDPNDPTPPTDTDSRTVENDKITMQIADITTYMGGESGFDGAVGLDGEADQSTSLPEPGFYLTLPDEINAELTYAIGESDPNKVVDLSQYITIEAKDGAGVAHTWTLDKYGTDVSTALEDGRERYIYKINGEGDNAPIRVEFRDENGKRVTNDTFTADDALAANYTMTIYLGDVKVETIDFVINIPTSKDDLTTVRTYHCGFDKDESDEAATLTIRHTDEAVVTDAVSSIAEALKDETKQDQFLVEVQNDQDFNINEADGASGVSVDVKNVHLLADELEPLEEEAGLVQTAQKKAGFASSGTDAQYLDLVDADNGNAWLTPDEGETVTVYWPYPAGTDKSTTFKLFHYEGMDRDAVNTAAADSLNPKEMTIVEKTDTGLTFKTDNFSPFVLVWDTTTSTGGGDNSSNDNNNSNTNNTNDQTTTVNVTNEAPAPAAPTAATVPQTSDDMPVGALTAAAAAAAAALVVLLVVRKRRHGKD
ncbi:hypothetical protein [uncultured Subdoligranulum sp.]|uniref:DUF7507 domain-containing protein n=1 Tax=uncultured Subdoligranulum sp. TaxID=512298 RepID=UPI0026132612|nr:hypothetical protein [uncultured Subdoligranulum sp.]